MYRMTSSTHSELLTIFYLIYLECFPRLNIAEHDYNYLALIYSETKV